MTMIIEDLNEEIMNAMRDEESAQVTYEKQMKAAKKLEAELLQKKIDLENMIAKREKEKADEIVLMTNNKADLKAEVDYRTKITPDCLQVSLVVRHEHNLVSPQQEAGDERLSQEDEG